METALLRIHADRLRALSPRSRNREISMAVSESSLPSIPTCYATVSIGTPSKPLPEKLRAIASAGFIGIELGFPDLQSFASQRSKREVGAQEWDRLCEAAEEVRKLCKQLGLQVVMLQPFSNFEGWHPEKQAKEREDAFERAKGWIWIMQAVGCEMLQVCYLPRLTLPASAEGEKWKLMQLLQ